MFIIKPQAHISAWILELAGYKTELNIGYMSCKASISVENHRGVCIGNGCSGLELFVLFFGFIFLMRGRLVDKLWFVPLGFIGILLLNVIRIVSLILIQVYKPEYLDFNHKYTFVIIVYGAIFGLWLLWVNKFSRRDESKAG